MAPGSAAPPRLDMTARFDQADVAMLQQVKENEITLGPEFERLQGDGVDCASAHVRGCGAGRDTLNAVTRDIDLHLAIVSESRRAVSKSHSKHNGSVRDVVAFWRGCAFDMVDLDLHPAVGRRQFLRLEQRVAAVLRAREPGGGGFCGASGMRHSGEDHPVCQATREDHPVCQATRITHGPPFGCGPVPAGSNSLQNARANQRRVVTGVLGGESTVVAPENAL